MKLLIISCHIGLYIQILWAPFRHLLAHCAGLLLGLILEEISSLIKINDFIPHSDFTRDWLAHFLPRAHCSCPPPLHRAVTMDTPEEKGFNQSLMKSVSEIKSYFIFIKEIFFIFQTHIMQLIFGVTIRKIGVTM